MADAAELPEWAASLIRDAALGAGLPPAPAEVNEPAEETPQPRSAKRRRSKSSKEKASFAIGISGPSCAGKTTLAEGLCQGICGRVNGQEPKYSSKDRVSRFTSECGNYRVSIVCQDSFFLGGDVNPDLTESLNHDRVLEVLRAEKADIGVDCIIFEGFKAFYDQRLLSFLDVLLWLEVPEEVAKKRRISRSSGRCTEEHFQDEVWANHQTYEEHLGEQKFWEKQRTRKKKALKMKTGCDASVQETPGVPGVLTVKRKKESPLHKISGIKPKIDVVSEAMNAIFGRAPPNVLAAMAVSERQEIERKMVPSRRREVYGLQEDPPEQNDFGRRCLSPGRGADREEDAVSTEVDLDADGASDDVWPPPAGTRAPSSRTVEELRDQQKVIHQDTAQWHVLKGMLDANIVAMQNKKVECDDNIARLDAKGARYAEALAATDVARLAHEKAVAMVSNLL